MMRKKWITALGMLSICFAASGQIAYRDTTAVAAPGYIPFYSQNLLVKSRLDSLQKTVPLTYNEYVQKYIDIYASRKEQVSKEIGLSGYYFPIFEKALNEYQVPEELKFVSIVESSLDPHAVSRSGATGPWQFMYKTGKAYGLKVDRNVDERKDPISASHAAAAYFRDAYNELGDWVLAIAAYNCGKGAVTRAIKKAGGKTDFWEIRKFLPLETRNYVPAFIATTYIMNCYAKHDIAPVAPDFPILTDVIEVSSKVSLNLIAKAAHFDLKQLLLLNPSYKKNIVNASPASPKHVVIPGVRDNAISAAIYQALNTEQTEEPAVFTTSDSRANKHLATYVSYKVRAGDTLSTIAEKFNGATIARIRSHNRLRSAVLQPGMILKIYKG